MSNSIHKTTLYRYFGGNGQLLYVGVTKNAFDRQAHHAQNQPWWGEVVSASFEHYATRDEALAAETFAIGSELPKYNKAGPVLELHAREHLSDIMAKKLDDEEHLVQSEAIELVMRELAGFSKQPEMHKLLFAFDRSIPWDDEGEERLVFCRKCQQILDSAWFKKLHEQIDSTTYDEAVSR